MGFGTDGNPRVGPACRYSLSNNKQFIRPVKRGMPNHPNRRPIKPPLPREGVWIPASPPSPPITPTCTIYHTTLLPSRTQPAQRSAAGVVEKKIAPPDGARLAFLAGAWMRGRR
jgi:hypothetical protein